MCADHAALRSADVNGQRGEPQHPLEAAELRKRPHAVAAASDGGAAAASTAGAGAAAPAVEVESSVEKALASLSVEWEALRPVLDGLRNAARGRATAWDELLTTTRRAVSLSDQALDHEQAALAKQRYGSDAHHFCVLPPSIARLLPLSARSGQEISFSVELERAVEQLQALRARLVPLLGSAKRRGDRAALRLLGPRHGELGAEMKAISGLDALVSQRMTLASRRVAAYRSRQALRDIDPSWLSSVPASMDGYTRILDFYRHSDARQFSFGRQPAGAQHFTDLRRNVAVLEVFGADGAALFNGYAVSGADGVGVQAERAGRELFHASEVADGKGEVYLRDQDAEFKLCASLCDRLAALGSLVDARAGAWRGRGVLFSKKPLCASCADVCLRQLPTVLPGLKLEVVVDESEDGGAACSTG
eukprot:TRINITY_DN37920_c0_g1_i1.p1 TRINITY_DN37920_c0_g1~~TRINITY_DN37920_c0_g1_i1.p1  ORF type:complete len:420 (+),score=110.95 TRINITY_DN37920_c0_g1_i1:78-1337(+)